MPSTDDASGAPPRRSDGWLIDVRVRLFALKRGQSEVEVTLPAEGLLDKALRDQANGWLGLVSWETLRRRLCYELHDALGALVDEPGQLPDPPSAPGVVCRPPAFGLSARVV